MKLGSVDWIHVA